MGGRIKRTEVRAEVRAEPHVLEGGSRVSPHLRPLVPSGGSHPAGRDRAAGGDRPGLERLGGGGAAPDGARVFRPSKRVLGLVEAPRVNLYAKDMEVKDLSDGSVNLMIEKLKGSLQAAKDWIGKHPEDRVAMHEDMIGAYQNLLKLMAEKRSRMIEEKRANVATWDYARNQAWGADYDIERRDGDRWTEEYRLFLNATP